MVPTVLPSISVTAVKVELSNSQAGLLHTQLRLRIEELEKEAAHTDRVDLQHALARDVDRLKEILGLIEAR